MSDPEFSRRALQVIINIERRLAKLTKRIITVGEQVTKDLLAVGVGRANQYVSIASEGAKLSFLSRIEARKQLNIELDTPVVLWMARMAPVKNPGLALEVAKLLPEINFLMAGGGDLFEETKSNAPSNVLLLGWVDAAEIIPVADIFLSTSLNEGIPYSLIEVQSYGIPIVAVNSGSIQELISDGVSGILAHPDAKDLVLNIRELLDDESKRERISMSARQNRAIADEKPQMTLAHKALYEKILH